MADKNFQTKLDASLVTAVESNNLALARVALMKGANIEARLNQIQVLSYCAMNDRVDMARVLLTHAKEKKMDAVTGAISNGFNLGKTETVKMMVKEFPGHIRPSNVLHFLFLSTAWEKSEKYRIADDLVEIGYQLDGKLSIQLRGKTFDRLIQLMVLNSNDGALEYLLDRDIPFSPGEFKESLDQDARPDQISRMEEILLMYASKHAASMDVGSDVKNPVAKKRARL